MVNQQPIADGGDEEDVPTSLEARKRHWAERGAGQPFGKVIECLRELRPLTRRQLEAASGRSYSQLRGLELGDRWPSDKTLVSIAGPLGFTGSALTGLRDELLRALLDRSEPAERALAGWIAMVPSQRDRPLVGHLDRDRVDVVWVEGGRTVASFELKGGKDGRLFVQASAIGGEISDVSQQVQAYLALIANQLSDRGEPTTTPAWPLVIDYVGSPPEVADPDFRLGGSGTGSAAWIKSRRSECKALIDQLDEHEADLAAAYLRGILDARRAGRRHRGATSGE